MIIRPAKTLRGSIAVPGDKSISHRALMLGAIATGRTRVSGVLECDDCNRTTDAFRKMGVSIVAEGSSTVIEGKGLRGLQKPAGPLQAGESGTTMRILPGILAGQPFETVIEGAPSLARRPMKRVVEPLSLMGVAIGSADGYPPLVVKGGAVRPVTYRMPVSSAQVKSAVLFAGLYADGTTTVEEPFVSRDHTERMMAFFGADIVRAGSRVSVRGLPATDKGTRGLVGRTFEVPGDISSAGFFMVAATVIPGAQIRIARVSVNPTRAGIIGIMTKMGARIRMTDRKDLFEPSADITVDAAPTRGITIEEDMIPAVIDELPILFVLAALSEGRTIIRGAAELRVKETDRIRSMQENLRAMGVPFEVEGEDIVITGARGRPASGALRGARLQSFGDHRTCMSMAVAALAARGESEIDEVACVTKSFPGFFSTLEQLTA